MNEAHPTDHALAAVEAAGAAARDIYRGVRRQGSIAKRLADLQQRFHKVGLGERKYRMSVPPDGERDDDLFAMVTVKDAIQRLELLTELLHEVRSAHTRDDDLPDDLLPRIDEAFTKGIR